MIICSLFGHKYVTTKMYVALGPGFAWPIEIQKCSRCGDEKI